tara:strand:- start:563 stop:955 length:393 start_codon:yes stop_codon:yes gene_type:complete
VSERKSVIIIDDSESVRSKLTLWFEEKKVNVISAKDGAEGYKKIKEKHRELVLIISDYNMPNMNGGELFQKLEQEQFGNDILKILLTTETPGSNLLDFKNITNFKGWILKPLNESKFSKIMVKVGIFKAT